MVCLEGLPGDILFFLNMVALLRFAKLHLNKPHNFWNNVLWIEETKAEMFGHNIQGHVWRKRTAKSPQTLLFFSHRT